MTVIVLFIIRERNWFVDVLKHWKLPNLAEDLVWNLICEGYKNKQKGVIYVDI